MIATVESLRWGDVTDWPRVTVERALDGFALRTNATEVAADVAYLLLTDGLLIHQIRIQPEHNGGPLLRVLLALVAAKAHGAGLAKVYARPEMRLSADLKALGFKEIP